MKMTRYFIEQVQRKRPGCRPDWCVAVISAPLRMQVQDDGRIRVIVDLGVDGSVVRFDIDHASQKLDLSISETSALPLRTTKAA